MEERPIVFETKETELVNFNFGELVVFISSAVTYLSVESHLAQSLEGEEREESIKRMIRVDQLLTLAKFQLNQLYSKVRK